MDEDVILKQRHTEYELWSNPGCTYAMIQAMCSGLVCAYKVMRFWGSFCTTVFTIFKDNGYPHDGRADKNPYPHDRRANKDSYPQDSKNLCIILRLQLSFMMINVQLMLV